VEGDLVAALEDMKQALQLEPKNGDLTVEHRVILLLLGRDKEAQTVSTYCWNRIVLFGKSELTKESLS
jgi:tetratricopeptide repeat protein